MNKKQLLEKVRKLLNNPLGHKDLNDNTKRRADGDSPGAAYLKGKKREKTGQKPKLEIVEGFRKLTPAARAALVQATKTGPMKKRREAKEKLATVMQQAKQIQKVKAKAKETWVKKVAAGPEVTPEPPAPKPEPKVAPKPKQSIEDRMALLKKVAQKRLMDVRTFNPKSKSNRDY